MSGLSLASCDRALGPGKAPDWVHLFPAGEIAGRDGRAFDLSDPGAVVLAFQSEGIDLPVDYEHQNDSAAAKRNGPVPAAGWIKELKAEANGIWGRVEWTATAREMIGKREYRYLSPSFLYHAKTGAIMRLKGAGLVHHPNFHLTALAQQEDAMDGDMSPLARIAAELGLDPEADADAILDAIRALAEGGGEPDPAKYVPIEALRDLLKERNTEAASASEQRARTKVEQACERGYLTGGMKDWALALCLRDEASFDSFLETAVPAYASLRREIVPAGAPGRDAPSASASPLAAAVCSQLGLKPDALA
ncbi:phage protease [Psychromarinibacter sp. C21-152]|uniref:Phage protease n=1 Tax=Psychromarinibacter sediminicola TaxID=3033385 RepID=A0AAE3T9K6_9RHOB|nr:phage protease [Psychromarinibacter sediminicola]MDF0602317.1 phage protease [Psychromarinibacter sediminicola]